MTLIPLIPLILSLLLACNTEPEDTGCYLRSEILIYACWPHETAQGCCSSHTYGDLYDFDPATGWITCCRD